MKRICIFLLIILSISKCIAVDTLGLTDTYKGDVAKKKLLDAAKIGDYLMANAYFTAQGYTGSELESYVIADVIYTSFIDEVVFNIDESKYYKKADVDTCAKVLQFLGVAVDIDSFTSYMSNFNCRLSPNDLLIDKNMGKSSNNPTTNK
ncbi:TIGR04452 family lipoprotein [Leptospira koniambonensis]|uniref:TIGR04452 family lipoprotein n=1 Tax=Leptospira koniambonensis TaxID=2484950 RepID=A0A4R9JBA6_9LEPT|nr:TIGR04452 family lipoprotein [Leptospira koniambonensis]TGL35925.1 TIGR04452 family lipoprotein [Leptospira koniambonensis]